ncbi:MAG: hypothetical protein AAGC58_08015 [Asticcacaulis sp.]
MAIAKPELHAVSYPEMWAKFEPQASYMGIIIDDVVVLRDGDLVKQLIPYTGHFVFIGIKSNEAEEIADWIIEENERNSIITSSVDEAVAPEVMALLNLAEHSSERSMILYVFDQNCDKSRSLTKGLQRELDNR